MTGILASENCLVTCEDAEHRAWNRRMDSCCSLYHALHSDCKNVKLYDIKKG